MIFYVFFDGIGYGENDPQKNPFARCAQSFFLPLAAKPALTTGIWQQAYYHPTDANMGIKGLAQSATGQTALWTGFNAPMILNRHMSGFPTITLKRIIEKYSLLKILKEHNYRGSFLNCYGDRYQEYIEKYPRRMSASTLVQMAAGLPLKTLDDLRQNNGLYMDITHEYLAEFGGKHLAANDPLLTKHDPFQQGKLAIQIARQYDLSLFEYFLTDKVGHGQDWQMAEKVIGDLEAFVDGMLTEMDGNTEQLIISSDHGNLEDLSLGRHTKNPVPTFLIGPHSQKFIKNVQMLSDIVPVIYEIFSIQQSFDDSEFISASKQAGS